ncbi:MAG: LTA synthase family protein, partial [Candidatus Tisiphia sp.]
RFNFIAVDYLIYTHEIIGTVKESLPYIEILLGIIIITLLIIFFLRKYIINQASTLNGKKHIFCVIMLFLLSLVAFNF